MFSSTNSSINPFPNLSSSPYNPSPYIIDHETDDIFLYHHHNPLSIPLNPTSTVPATGTVLNVMAPSSNAIMSKQDVHALNGQQHNPSHFLSGKISMKKDRSTKIYTSQGLRDRRVRLSIEIARKFFGLQDMLGFDKASKTLEWLLTKSKKAIKELARNGGVESLSSTSTNCEVVSEIGDLEERVLSKSESLAGVSTDKRMKKLRNTTASLLSRESREKARERARERTLVKMCTRRLHEPKKCPDSSPSCLNQHQISCEKSAAYNGKSSLKVIAPDEVEGPSSYYSLPNQPPTGNIVEESLLSRRKLKPSATKGYQHNFLMLRDASCNNNSSACDSPNLAQNWDISSVNVAHSSFRAFTNMNPSKGLL
ncbi:hypothetical protein NC652_011115 [Populus alba x Populus x berolinensis]|nr:hypothetical protein NC652_011115 [Populus alba x Populus x berolinensis]